MIKLSSIVQRFVRVAVDAEVVDGEDMGSPKRCISSTPEYKKCVSCTNLADIIDFGDDTYYNSPWCKRCSGYEELEDGYAKRVDPDLPDITPAQRGVTEEEWATVQENQLELLPPIARMLDTHTPYYWCFLLGSVGTGKSTQGMLAIDMALKAGLSDCLFIQESTMLERLRPSSRRHKELSFFESKEFLVIDEAFSDLRSDKAWQSDQIRFLLHSRHRRKLPTVLLSNHSLASIAHSDRLGLQVQRRIIEAVGLNDHHAVGSYMSGYIELTYSHAYRVSVGPSSTLKMPEGYLNIGPCQYPRT